MLFTWNGTTSGVRVPNGDWIPAERAGLTFVDATSAVFAQPIDWAKVDVLTFSWQKALGGEAAHGMLILSPRAVERLESYTPPWPLPKIFRLTKGGKLIAGRVRGRDHQHAVDAVRGGLPRRARWAERIGGLQALFARADANAKVLYDWVERTPWVENLAADPATRSNTSVCLKIVDPAVAGCRSTRSAPSSSSSRRCSTRRMPPATSPATATRRRRLRIWCGSTVETADVEALTPWLDWAFAEAKAGLAKAA